MKHKEEEEEEEKKKTKTKNYNNDEGGLIMMRGWGGGDSGFEYSVKITSTYIQNTVTKKRV